jgi:hypothetical protein
MYVFTHIATNKHQVAGGHTLLVTLFEITKLQ